MKKLIYLFLAISILSSCESDNDEGTNAGDPIIGKWQLSSEKENGVEESTECSRKSTATFSANGNFSYQGFYSDGGAVCENENTSGTWKNESNSNYTLDFSDDDKNTTKVTFSQNNTVFTTTDTETYNGQTYTYIQTFKKI